MLRVSIPSPKTLLPALRLAGVAGEAELIARLLSLKVADDLGCSAFLQRALARFIEQGRYHRHLERVRPQYAKVRDLLRVSIAGMQPGITFDNSPTGFCMVGRLERGIEAGRFIAEVNVVAYCSRTVRITG